MNCINLKIKMNKTLYCKDQKREIKIKDCNLCRLKEYAKKQIKYKNDKKVYYFKKKTSKLAEMEKNRFSVFADNMNKCFLCGNKYRITKHEIYSGRNRLNSMRYGLVLPLCSICHSKYQNDAKFNQKWHITGQIKFKEIYPDLDFLSIFKKSYL